MQRTKPVCEWSFAADLCVLRTTERRERKDAQQREYFEVTVRFEGREISTHGVFVKASELVVGQVYFRIAFLDDDMAIPQLTPSVFIGRNLDGEDEPGLFFQDVESFLAGEQYDPLAWSS